MMGWRTLWGVPPIVVGETGETHGKDEFKFRPRTGVAQFQAEIDLFGIQPTL